MSSVKKLLDVYIYAQSYALLNPLVESIYSKPELLVQDAVQMMFAYAPYFPLDAQLLNDTVHVLAKLFKANLSVVVKYIDSIGLKGFSKREIAQIRQNFYKISQPKQTKTSRYRQTYYGTDTFCQVFYASYNNMCEEASRSFYQLLLVFTHCFTQYLYPAVNFQFDKNLNQSSFYGSLVDFCTARIPQIHPCLSQIFAPPIKQMSDLYATGPYPWSKHQVHISFSNEGFDEPDIFVDYPEWYSVICASKDQQLGDLALKTEKLLEICRMSLKTRKPVPYHHALIDVSGCYVSQEVAYHGLVRQLRLLLQERQLFMIDLYSLVSMLMYFPPFKCVVDYRFYGTVSRFARFCSTQYSASAYLKALGVGGGVRFQMHAILDIAAEEEAKLFYQAFSVIKGGSPLSEVIVALEKINSTMTHFFELQPWKQQQEYDSMAPEYYQLVRASFLANACWQMCYDFPILWTPVTNDNLIYLLEENLIFTFPEMAYIEFGNPKQSSQLVTAHNALALFSSTTSTIASGNEYVPLIFENMRYCGLLADESRFLAFIAKFSQIYHYEQVFINLLVFFALQCAFSFYDYQFAVYPQNAMIQRLRAFLYSECDRVMAVSVSISVAPHYYPNYVPYVAFSPLLRTCFDLQAEKLLLITFQALSKYLIQAGGQDGKFPETELKKIAYRLVYQNGVFNRLIYGIYVPVENYIQEFSYLLSQNTYRDVDEAVAQYIDVDVRPLVDYATFASQNAVRRIGDHLDCLICAFKGRIDPLMYEPVKINVTTDMINLVARSTYELFGVLAHMTAKQRADDKRTQIESNNWPACEHVGHVSINAKYGGIGYMPVRVDKLVTDVFEDKVTTNTSANYPELQDCFGEAFSWAISQVNAVQEVYDYQFKSNGLNAQCLEKSNAAALKADEIDSKTALQDLMGVIKDMEEKNGLKE